MMNESLGGERDATVKKLLESVSSGQILVAGIAALLVPLLLAINVRGATAQALALLLAVALVGGAVLLWRRSERLRRDKALQEKLDQQAEERILQSAFRGLSSYTRGDQLPGKTRQKLAKRVATSVAHDLFRYGLISGEIGAGKSSLLDSGVRAELERAGRRVDFVSGLQGFSGDRSIETVTDSLRRKWRDMGDALVVILDQFEEMLIQWNTPPLRAQLGAFIADPVPGKAVRVLCSVRADYIIAMHDLAPSLADPTSARTLFPIKNFDQDEAVDVILECAQRDRVKIDADLARTIAADLSHGGRVRPPELQLVCQSLLSGDPERRYREGGGAEGILSDYIKNAADYSAAPDLARLVLRTLCNLQAMPPAKMPAQTVREIGASIGLAEGDPRSGRLEQVLSHLEHAGLITCVAQVDANAYALIHDYLVQAVVLATADVSTQAERATQLLRLHLTEYAADNRSRMPLRRIQFIRKYADPELLASAPARALIRRSYRRGAISAAAATAGAAALVALILQWDAVTPHWVRSPEIGTQSPDGSVTVVQFSPILHGRQVYSSFGNYLTFWDAKSGRLLRRLPGTHAEISEDAGVIAFQLEERSPSGQNSLAVYRAGGKVVQTPLKAGFSDSFGLDPQGKMLFAAEDVDENQSRVRVLRLADGQIVLDTVIHTGSHIGFDLNRAGTAILVLQASGGKIEPTLWPLAKTGAEPRVMMPAGATFVDQVIDPANDVVAILGRLGAGRYVVSLWSLNDGRLIVQREIASVAATPDIRFVGEGRFIRIAWDTPFIGRRTKLSPFHFLRVDDLLPPPEIPRDVDAIYALGDFVGWVSEGRTRIWDTRGGPVVTASSLKLDNIEFGELSRDSQRMIVRREKGVTELWDTQRWRQVSLGRLPTPAIALSFTADDGAVLAEMRSGQYALLNSADGHLIQTFGDLKDISASYYDRDCERATFWTNQGLVVQFIKGREWPLFGFRPSQSCALQKRR
jgi:hypothetical protein